MANWLPSTKRWRFLIVCCVMCFGMLLYFGGKYNGQNASDLSRLALRRLIEWLPTDLPLMRNLFGAESQQKLLFVPDADNKPEEDHEISEPAIFRFLLNEETLQQLDEAGAEMPQMLGILKDIDKNWEIKEFETHQSSMGSATDLKKAFHVFIVFKTASSETNGVNWWWSLEKNSKYIVLQRSRNKNNVKDKFCGQTRTKVKPIEENLKGKGTIKDLFTIFLAQQVIAEKYNILYSNCQSLVTFVSKQITEIGYEYQGYFPYSSPPESGRNKKMLDLINILTGVTQWPPLFTLIEMGNTDLVDKFIKSGKYDINALYNGLTPLHFAIRLEKTKMVQHLLQPPHSADPTTRNQDGMDALHSAAMFTMNTGIIELLLAHSKISVDDIDENRYTALHMAVHVSNVIAVQKLLEKGANPNIVDHNGLSPLHEAALERDGIPIIDLLLEAQKVKGIGDVNDRDKQGWTALHYAARASNEITAEHLIEKGADLHCRDNDGDTPLHLAAYFAKDMKIIDLLLLNIKEGDVEQYRNDKELFHCAKQNEHRLEVEIIDRLLKKGIQPPCIETDECWTEKSDEATGVNTRHSADKDVDPSIDMTGFDGDDFFITRIKNLQVIAKNEGCFNINARDQYGETFLFLAILANNVDWVRIMLENGADPTVRNNKGFTPFHLAAGIAKDCDILNLLLESGKVDINETTSETTSQRGMTALHKATCRSNLIAARFLLSKGVNPNAADENGRTPLYWAAMLAKDMDIVELLVNHPDVDVNYLDNKGQNALDYAAFNENGIGERIVNLLKEKGVMEREKKLPKVNNKECLKKDIHFYINRKPSELENIFSDDTIPFEDQLIKFDKFFKENLISAIKNSDVNRFRLLLKKGGDISVRDFSVVDSSSVMGLNLLHVVSFYAKTTDLIDAVLETDKFDINGVDNKGNTPLHWAISGINFEIKIRHLIRLGADPTIANKNGVTLLHLAAYYATTDITSVVLENKQVDINHIDKKGLTALHYGAKHVEITRYLLKKGADPTISDENGLAPFHLAAQHLTDTHVLGEVLGLMLGNEKKMNIDEKNEKGETALHLVMTTSNLIAAGFLLSNGANPNAADKYGRTPLHLAALLAKDMDIVELLLNHPDVDVNYLDNVGNSVLHYAMDNKYGLGEGIYNVLRVKIAGKADECKTFAVNSFMEKFRLLIEDGQDISAMSWAENGANALHVASRYANTADIIDFILDTGKFDINGVDNDGRTPLHFAMEGYYSTTNARHLIGKGADPDIASKNGVTPLHLAARNAKNTELIDIILETGKCNINGVDNDGSTPLHWAMDKLYPLTFDNVRHLIEMGADPGIADKDGVTPLHMAAIYADSMDLIDELLLKVKTGAVDVNCVDKQGRTPLAYAQDNEHGLGEEIIARLKEYGAKN